MWDCGRWCCWGTTSPWMMAAAWEALMRPRASSPATAWSRVRGISPYIRRRRGRRGRQQGQAGSNFSLGCWAGAAESQAGALTQAAGSQAAGSGPAAVCAGICAHGLPSATHRRAVLWGCRRDEGVLGGGEELRGEGVVKQGRLRHQGALGRGGGREPRVGLQRRGSRAAVRRGNLSPGGSALSRWRARTRL